MRTLFVAAAIALLAACPKPGDLAGSSKTSTVAGNPQSNPENSTAMNPAVAPQRDLKTTKPQASEPPAVQVQLTEYTIEMPDTLTAGTHQLTIANAGKDKHNFAIEGPGVNQKLASDLMRGDTAPMTVTLRPGVYTVYCPVDGHRGRGMERTITVP